MTLDRGTALKQAEKLLRQGKLEGAIAEYVRFVEAFPRDWNAINALGDLYVRAGDAGRAVALFTRIADFLLIEGFLPRAAALYKKALKVMPTDEHTLRQLGDIAARQGRLGDAKVYFRQLADQRRARGADTDTDAMIAAARPLGPGVEQGASSMADPLPAEAGRDRHESSLPADAGTHLSEDAHLADAGIDLSDDGLEAEAADEAVVASGFSRSDRELDVLELDLSDALAALTQPDAPAAAPPLEAVFEGMRARAAQEQQAASAADDYRRGVDHLQHGRVEAAMCELQAAARVPMFRFQAAAQLGRLHVDRGDLQRGVDWLERAAEAPAPTPEEGFALLYDLAGALERLGESARALAVLMELDADAGGYRDVRARVDQLSRIQGA